MSGLRDKIGQMLIMGFAGCEVDANHPVVHWIQKEALGGVLLFYQDVLTGKPQKNLKNCEQIRTLTHQLRSYARAPLFIALDYEGGAVDRLTHIEGCKPTLSAYQLAQLTDHEFFIEADRMAQTLKYLGFNLNFAPVVDLALYELGIIGGLERSFSSDANIVIRAARQFVDAFYQHGITCAYKHFPGHGSAIGDTHAGCVDVTETFKSEELFPYKELLHNGEIPCMVMTAHVINRQLDGSGLPATLSYTMLTQLLRQQIGFDGVIISDDLQMHAISHHYSLEEGLYLSLVAGVDMFIVGNQFDFVSATEVINCIENLINEDKVTEARIEESYQRVQRLRQAMPALLA